MRLPQLGEIDGNAFEGFQPKTMDPTTGPRCVRGDLGELR